MTAERFRDLAAALFGANWRSPLAHALNIDKRAVQRWANGQNAVPDWVEGWLHAWLAAKIEADRKLLAR